MNPTKIFWLTVVGLAIGGADSYFQVHLGGPYGLQYWLGMIFALLVPVGSYFIGLAQPRVSATFNQQDTPEQRAVRVVKLQKQVKDLQSYADHIASEAGIHRAILDKDDKK